MQVRDFNGTTQDYRQVAYIINTVWPKQPVDGDELRRSDEQRKPRYICRRFLAEKGEQAIAYGMFEHRKNMYQPHRFFVTLDVLPAYRNQGVGKMLYEHMLTIMTSVYAAQKVHSSTSASRPSSINFLKKCGFQEVKRQWESRLDTANFDVAEFRDCEAQVEALAIKISVLSDLMLYERDALRKLYELHQRLVMDVPGPAERTRVDFDTWHQGYSTENQNFLPEANFIALHDRAYIGLGSLWGDPSLGKLYTGMTGVERPFRRKGIATVLKLRGIRFAQALDNLPLITYNDSDNPMLNLNLKLGFKQHDAEVMFLKTIVD